MVGGGRVMVHVPMQMEVDIVPNVIIFCYF